MDKEQRIGVMSIGFLLEDMNDAVVWRGPKKNGKSQAKQVMSIYFYNYEVVFLFVSYLMCPNI